MPNETLERKCAAIRLVVFDVDGVLTDGRLWRGGEGMELQAFNVRDGHGIRLLQDRGFVVAILSGRASRAAGQRMAELGVELVYTGYADKTQGLDALLAHTGITADRAAYLGDDLPDLPVMRRVGLAVAVADAEPEIKAVADWITPRAGGAGGARDLANLLLRGGRS